MNACALIPVYEHGDTVGAVVEEVLRAGLTVLLVDDGSSHPTQRALALLAERHPAVEVLRLPHNRGKGAALKAGYRAAHERGFSHVVQLDADGQHDAGDVPRFVAAMRAEPGALVLGVPVFDESVPRARLCARQISRVLVWLACLSRTVPDPLCGFRGVPLGPALALLDREPTGDRMEFEPEIAVRLVWDDVPVARLPTRVVYPEGGVSHFSVRRDYPKLASLYARLLAGMPRRAPLARRRVRRAGGAT